MLVSLFIKEKMYIGEATVATIVGVIFGPHAANLFNPMDWGNTDQITLECSRIVLVVQCFAVGVELPKSYMERHWRSVVFLLVPVMAWGWVATSLFIWWMIEPLTWLESLAVSACVTATDPVLASSVVGKGKFAKRVPKHLRDVLSAESGCNDGMAFPFIYLSLYLIRYHLDGKHVAFHWFCFTILYECVFGAFFGFMVGYIGRHAIKQAEKTGLIDRESFLVFYFVLALFCAGAGSLLGMDDLLIGFAAGVGFSNDGWFTEKTEESHVSNVIDLLLNLAYFVYFGSIIPWDQFNAPNFGLTPWRLVVVAIFVIFFRRIPAMLALKPLIPDIKTWREALFAGHFGPIGVGAIFVAILARAELETESTVPLAILPESSENSELLLIQVIWPITTFLVISSILVHGSSIAVFTLGKRINTLSLTLSYTQDNQDRSWMDRLPRIQSQSRSMARSEESSESLEKPPEFPPNTLPPVGYPRNFLRRQKEEDTSRPGSRASSLRPLRRRKTRDPDLRPGGKVEESAIRPARLSEPLLVPRDSSRDSFNENIDNEKVEDEDVSPGRRQHRADIETGQAEDDIKFTEDQDAEIEVYEEGPDMVIEDEEGNVLRTEDISHLSPEQKAHDIEETRQKLAHETSGEHTKHKHEPHPKTEGDEFETKAEHKLEEAAEEATGQPGSSLSKYTSRWRNMGKGKKPAENAETTPPADGKKKKEKPPAERKRGPAHAYQFGNTIIVEDEDGEVVKKYTIPAAARRASGTDGWLQKTNKAVHADDMRKGLTRMGTWVGLGGGTVEDADKAAASAAGQTAGHGGSVNVNHKPGDADADSDDDGVRYVVSRTEHHGPFGTRKERPNEPTIFHSGRRMSKTDFIKQIQSLDPKTRAEAVEESSAPEAVKRDVKRQADAKAASAAEGDVDYFSSKEPRRGRSGGETRPFTQRGASALQSHSPSHKAPPQEPAIPEQPERPGTASSASSVESASIPTHDVASSVARFAGSSAARRRAQLTGTTDASGSSTPRKPDDNDDDDDEMETAAEKRRRLAALGTSRDQESSDDEDFGAPRHQTKKKPNAPARGVTKPSTAAKPAAAPAPAPEPEPKQVPPKREKAIEFADATANAGPPNPNSNSNNSSSTSSSSSSNKPSAASKSVPSPIPTSTSPAPLEDTEEGTEPLTPTSPLSAGTAGRSITWGGETGREQRKSLIPGVGSGGSISVAKGKKK